jgi:hypothetical protein
VDQAEKSVPSLKVLSCRGQKFHLT